MSGEDHDRDMRIATPDPAKNSQATETWHDEIEKDSLDRGRLQYAQTFIAVEGHERLVTKGSDRFRDHLGDRRIVVHYQDSHGYRRLPVSGAGAGSSRAWGRSGP